jgi:hypothetical protein
MFFTCQICFGDIDGARAAMHELAKLGIESKIFDGVKDPFSPAVFVGAWRAVEAIEKQMINISFERIIEEIADRHDGSADCFGIDDHIPIPSDFGFSPEDAA